MNISDSPDHHIHDYILYCLIIFKCLPIDMFLFICELLVLSVVCFEINMSLHISSVSNVVVYTVYSHCTLKASLVQVILHLRVLLFIFITFIFSCITCMKLIGHDCKN